MLTNFLTAHPNLAKGVGLGARSKETVDRQWNDLASKLNAHCDGASKTGQRWKRYWADLKFKTKNKAARRRSEASGTGGGPPTLDQLTDVEQKVLSITGEGAVFGDTQHKVPAFRSTTQLRTHSDYSDTQTTAVEHNRIAYNSDDDGDVENAESPPPPTGSISDFHSINGNSPSSKGVSSLNNTTTSASTSRRPVPYSPRRPAVPHSPRRLPSRANLENPVPLQRLRNGSTTTRGAGRIINQTRQRAEPSWVVDLERRRVDAENKLADAAMITAEASRTQAAAALVQAEAARMQVEVMRKLAETAKDQTEALLKLIEKI